MIYLVLFVISLIVFAILSSLIAYWLVMFFAFYRKDKSLEPPFFHRNIDRLCYSWQATMIISIFLGLVSLFGVPLS